jgi:hypothetical protein
MAAPILLNIRAVQEVSAHKFYFALTSFALVDSGILFELEYDEDHKHPWGVTIVQVKGGSLGYFTSLNKEALQKFSSAMSSYLNSFHGFLNDAPKALLLSEVMTLSEKVVTFRAAGVDDIQLIDLNVTQQELVKQLASTDIEFFKGEAPDYVVNPPKLLGSSTH